MLYNKSAKRFFMVNEALIQYLMDKKQIGKKSR